MKNQHKSSNPYPQWNNEKFEAKLEKEINQRKNLISNSTNYINQSENKNNLSQLIDTNGDMPFDSTGIYKQFLLIGVPPSVDDSHDPNVQPSVLIAYPPFEYPNMPTKKIIDYCMPTGHTRKFLSSNSLSPIQDEFVFQFSGGLGSASKPIYGVCVHVSTKDTSLPFYGHKTDKDRIFCFCIMTKMPIFSVHFSFLTSLVLWTIGHVRHLHKYETKIQVNISLGLPIEDLDLEDQIGHHPSITVPISFQNEIASYYISNITAKPEKLSRASSTFMQGYVSRKLEKMNNKKHNFRYSTEDCSIELKFPPIDDISENSILWASLDTLFSLLSVPEILSILCSLLLDRQVLIIGSRLEEVSMTVWALQSLIRPFKFSGAVIPILPTTSENYLTFLQSPTPFLFGVPRCNELKTMDFLETAVFADLDKKNVPPIEDLPIYPNENYIKSELTKFLYSIKNKQELNEFSFPTIYKKTLHHKYSFSTSSCLKISEIISSPFQNSIYNNYICGFFVSTEGVTVFNEELFLGQIYSLLSSNPDELYGETFPLPTRGKEKEKRLNEEIEFWNNIVTSQTFQLYLEERLQNFMKMKYQMLNNIAHEDDDIKKKNDPDDKKNISNSDNDDDIKDIDKQMLKKDIKTPLSKSYSNVRKNSKNDLIERSVKEPLISNPTRIGLNKKIHLKNPQRNKSLKNVLDDLPTPSSSINRLLDINEDDKVKSDNDAIDELNDDNIRLSNQKVSKSSNLAVVKDELVSDDEENKKNDKKSSQKKKVNQKQNKFNSDTESDNETKNKSQKNRRLSNSKKAVNNDNDNSDGEDKNVKHRRSSTSKPTRKSSNNNDNDDDSDEEIEKDKGAKHRKPTASKQTRKSSNNNDSDDDENVKDNSTRRRQSTKPARKSSSNNYNDGDDEGLNKKHRKSTASKPARKSSNNNDNDDEDEDNRNKKPTTKQQRKSSSTNNNDNDDNENERSTRHRKSSSSKSARKSSSTNNNEQDEDEEHDRSRRHRKSSGSNAKPHRKTSTTNNDDDDDEDNKRHRRSSDAKQGSKSQKPIRKASSNNDVEDEDADDKNRRHNSRSRWQKPTRRQFNSDSYDDDDSEENSTDNQRGSRRQRKSDPVRSSNKHPQKPIHRSSGNNNKDDEDSEDNEQAKENMPKLRKVNSNEKQQKMPRKSSSNNINDDDDDDNENDKENISKQKKVNSNDKQQKTQRKSSNNNDDDDDEDNENERQKEEIQKTRRKSAPTAVKQRSNENEEKDEDELENENDDSLKNRKKSNENEVTRKRSKSGYQSQALKKKLVQNMLNRKRSNTNINDDENKKKKIQIKFNSSSEFETYSSSESFNPDVLYNNEELDRSTSSYED